MPITRGRRIAPARIRAALEGLLEASKLCALATVSGARPHANTVYFAWGAAYRIVWLSDPAARHSRNLAANPRGAIAVFDSRQTWGQSDRGLQLFGRGRKLTGRSAAEALDRYSARFPRSRHLDLSGYRCYELRPRTVKVFDESSLGSGVFVSARVGADGAVTWERTEISTATPYP